MKLPREVLWIAGLTLLAAGLGFLLGGSRSQEEQEAQVQPVPTTYSNRPEGMRALYETLARLGYDVRRSRLPISPEDPPAAGTLVIAGPMEPLSGEEERALQEWVKAGNRLLLVSAIAMPNPLEAGHEPKLFSPRQPVFLCRQVDRLAVMSEERLRLSPSKEKQPYSPRPLVPKAPGRGLPFPGAVSIFGDDKGAIVAYAALGKGDAIFVNEVWPLTNAGVGREDNLVFILNTLGPAKGRAITFDEYHHGYSADPLWKLLPLTAKLGLAQVLLGLLVIIYARSRRFGPIVPLERGWRERSEFLGTMATVLAKGGAARSAARTAREATLQRLKSDLGLPPESDEAALLAAVNRLNPEAGQELASVLADSREALRHDRLSEARAAELVRRLDEASEHLLRV